MKKILRSFWVIPLVVLLAVSMANAYVVIGQRHDKNDWAGLSTEAKPTYPTYKYGSTFYETDTLTPYVLTGEGWVEDQRGGTGGGGSSDLWGSYASITGPTAARTYTFPDASVVMLYSGGPLGTPPSGTLTNCTGYPAAAMPSGIDAAKIANSTVTNEAFQNIANLAVNAQDWLTTLNTDLTSGSDPGHVHYYPIQVVAGAGTVDAITADYTPNVAALADKIIVGFVAAGANTSATPTFSPDGLTAKTIVKESNHALVAGDIPGANYLAIVQYNSTLDKWVLLNPAIPTNAGNASTADASDVQQSTTASNLPVLFAASATPGDNALKTDSSYFYFNPSTHEFSVQYGYFLNYGGCSKSMTNSSADGLVSMCTVNASAGTPVRMSPRLKFAGRAWDGANSKVHQWIMECLPVAGATTTSTLDISNDPAAGSFTKIMSITQAGKFTSLPTTNGPVGTFTCANNKDTVISNTCVSANSNIILQATNAAGATLMGSAASLYVSARTAGTSFTVTTANDDAAAGTETFNYRIDN